MERETKPKILQLSQMRNILLGNELQQGRLKSVATRKTAELSAELKKVSDAMTEAREQEVAAKEKSNQKQMEIQNRLGSAVAEAQQLFERVQQIEKQRDSYAAAGLAGTLIEIKTLPGLQEELASKKTQLQTLTIQGTDIQSRFASMKEGVKDSITERRERRRAESQIKAREAQKCLDDHNAQSAKAIQQATVSHTAELSAEEALRSKLIEENSRVRLSV